MAEPRYIAVKLLCKTFAGGSYSNLQLSSGLNSSGLDERGKKLCSAIYYGVIERKITLDCIIGGLSSRPLKKLDAAVLNILRSGIYQLLYMDSVPDSAAVDESVRLAKQFGKTSASGMVNAVLRNFIRQGKTVPVGGSGSEALSVKYSAPVELVESLARDYGMELAEDLLSSALDKQTVWIRKNPLRCTDDELIQALDGLHAERSELCPDCFKLENGDPTLTTAFRRGFFHVQDLSSQLCCMALAPSGNDRVLDICAAPGGKTFTMAEMMSGRGEIFAFDLHEKRVKLIREGAERLGLTNIRAAAGDASKFDPSLPQFTKILCDVPCSGFGVIGKKPEIKYKELSGFGRLPEIQYNIASNALNYLAPGGELVYSTCTLRKAENDEVCDRLLREHPEIEQAELPEPLGGSFGCRASIFPKHFGSDGFFIAKFRRIR